MPVVAPMAELEARMHAAVSERTANAVVERDVGPAFTARLDVRDRDAFGAVVGTHTLRYLVSAGALSMGQWIQIDGAAFRVLEPPRQISRHECIAQVSEA